MTGIDPPRTELARLIRERRLTIEAFSEEAERFAREHNLEGTTLSARHVQRLAAGQRGDGRALGPVRPVTRKLLEEMLGRPVEELLGPPSATTPSDAASEAAAELRSRLVASRTVDGQLVAALQRHIDGMRIVDRRLGGAALLAELRARIGQIQRLLHHCLAADARKALARVLVDACTLTGWLALDRMALTEAWLFYEQAVTAAREAESPALEGYARAGQSTVLLDIGETAAAIELTSYARDIAKDTAPPLLRSWIEGAHGEAYATEGLAAKSLSAFDEADRLLGPVSTRHDAPFLVFDAVHLARWRGSGLAKLADREATGTLYRTLERLDPTFVRAEAAMRLDIAEALRHAGEMEEASAHCARALTLSLQIGSIRQQRRADREMRAATR